MNLLNKITKLFENFFFRLMNLNDIKSNIDKLKINQGKLLIKNLKDCDLDNLDNLAFSIYSQFNEDGIIQFLINNLDIKNKEFIEIGVENFEEANTRFLLQNNCWKGLIIDSLKENINFIKKQTYYWRYQLEAEDVFITKENVNNIIKKYDFKQNIGLLSIDIDGNDYWVWDAISSINPDVLIIEYNSLFGSEKSLTIKYDKNFVRPNRGIYKCLYGASLKALTNLSEKKGYSLVAVNSNGNNAFYVRNELLNEKIYKRDVIKCFKKNTFKEYIDIDGEIKNINNDDLNKLLISEKIVEI
tara:strand:+ start:1752 stop:2651 length:900 start_codon:yes stop_codon:yes gene_type:complete